MRPADYRLTSSAGLRWLTNPHDLYVGKSLHLYGEWSFGEVEFLTGYLAAGDNVIEAGSNLGSHSVHLARRIHPGKLYCFEPQRLAFQLLCANLALNGVVNGFAFPYALGARNGEGGMAELDPNNPGNMGMARVHPEGYGTRIVALDGFLAEWPPIRLVKCDVEGWERDVLVGAEALIARDRPLLYLEDDKPEFTEKLVEKLLELDYRMWMHRVPLFRPGNAAGQQENVFGGTISMNLFCAHCSVDVQVEGLEPITGKGDHPTLLRMRGKTG
jgi:FkbM family methyltransferase